MKHIAPVQALLLGFCAAILFSAQTTIAQTNNSQFIPVVKDWFFSVFNFCNEKAPDGGLACRNFKILQIEPHALDDGDRMNGILAKKTIYFTDLEYTFGSWHVDHPPGLDVCKTKVNDREWTRC